MAAFSQSGKVHAGQKSTIAVNGGASPVAPAADTLTIHGVKLTIQEWVRRGVLRVATTSGNTVNYQILHDPLSV